ncbi:unannotated protein [freshwater metagenome]|uniref:Unannotated protein n=1 Tax=freshwater metagenome TaxID=449393 RepID=A0A6J6H1M1_9ZZZZ|nr:hypothetical protein [Actinomycetota bacterium]
MAASLDDLIRRADLDELVRFVDGTCDARDWDLLVDIRNKARSAVSTGRQLWPIATLANYRLALWSPAEYAVRALDDTARTFMPGPVSEIIAVHHTWEELEEHLADGHDRSLIAHERAMRGDGIDEDEHSVLEIPMELQEWEPRYVMASYTDDGVDFPSPDVPSLLDTIECVSSHPIDDLDSVLAFRRLVEPWTTQSNGTAEAVVVEGGTPEALGALGLSHARTAPLTADEALGWLAWAGASGGSHGKRRGAATGRGEAWWFLATFVGLADDWPCYANEFGDVISSLEFTAYTYDKAPTVGWGLHLVIEDPEEGLAIALRATDVE